MIDYTNNFESTNDDDVDETLTDVVDSAVVEEEDDILMGVVYNTHQVYVRSDSNKDSEPITILDKGAEIFVNGEVDDASGTTWYSVTTAMGQEGYIMAEYVKIVH